MTRLKPTIKSLLLLMGFGWLSMSSHAVSISKPQQDEPNQNLLYGTWCDPKTNEWIIGFFDTIAVYENQAWHYQIVSNKKSNYRVELKKGDKTKLVKVKLIGKDKKRCKLTDNNFKIQLIHTPKPLPYSYTDTKPFVDNGYKIDSVTIHGYLQNVPNREKPFSVAYTNILTDKQDHFYADINEDGLFTLTFPVLNSTEVFLDWGRSTIIDIVEPGETYFIYIDFAGNPDLWQVNNEAIWHMGDNARLHREMTISRKLSILAVKYPYYDEYRDKLDLYLDVMKDIFERNSEATKQYIINNPQLSDRMLYYLEKNDVFDFAFRLMQGRFGLDRNKKEQFSVAYMQLADSIMNVLPTPLTVVNGVSPFIRDYTAYYKEKERGNVILSEVEALKYFDKQGVFPLTDTQRNAVKEATHVIGRVLLLQLRGKSEDDKEKVEERINEMTKPYEECLLTYYDLTNDPKFKQLLENEWINVQPKAEILTEIEQVETLNLSELLNDLLLTRYAFYTYSAKRKPFQDEAFNLLSQKVKHQEFRSLLQEEQNKYVDLQDQSIRYVESLKRTDHLKDAKDADELLKKLTEPYLGKVIYIDFWGVWCGPCKMQMQYAGKVKEGLKGKDVVFIYFANRSPEDSWKNVIKQYDLTGENVIHYNLPEEQQDMLERRLGVTSFPTYMIMDKTGKIVDMNPPVPMNTDALINELKKWTEK